MKTVAFLWDNFGPMHVDRCEAVQTHLDGRWKVLGIEEFTTSQEYAWVPETGTGFTKVTLLGEKDRKTAGVLKKARAIISAIRKHAAQDVFFCNWGRPEVFLAALYNRLSGRGTYIMGCSKFDDMPRRIRREALKSFFYMPYQGGIASGERSVDYLRFMGVPERRITRPYNTLSVARIRNMANTSPAPEGAHIESRHFTIVARFVEKKNLFMALEAYALYRLNAETPRDLHLCGSGALEKALRTRVIELGLDKCIKFRGFLQTDAIAGVLGQSYALLLPSIEEQFGNVVIEAQAMGLPVLLSTQCGARDHLVRSGVNGFVFEPDNAEGLAFFMGILDRDPDLWARMCRQSVETAGKGDVGAFANAVEMLISPIPTKAIT